MIQQVDAVTRKLQITDADIMRIAIQQEIARFEASRYDHRLHGRLLISSRQNCDQVATLFGEDRRTSCNAEQGSQAQSDRIQHAKLVAPWLRTHRRALALLLQPWLAPIECVWKLA